MTTAIITTPVFSRPDAASTLRPWAARFGAKLRHLIELSAAPYLVMGSRYL